MADSTAIEPSGPVAWSDPTTRRSIRSYRVKGWITAVVGCALLTVAVVIASSATDRADELEEIGTRTDGIVVDVSSGFRSEGHIDVRFTAADEEQVKQINLNSDSPRYRVGDEVTVIYDPDNLSNLRTDVEENDSGWSVLASASPSSDRSSAFPGALSWRGGRSAGRGWHGEDSGGVSASSSRPSLTSTPSSPSSSIDPSAWSPSSED